MQSRSRVVFVDLLRFVAAMQMLQGHTVAALLAPSHRDGAWYELWSAARGLTSVAFLFAAGLSFYLATERAQPKAAADARADTVRRSLRALRLIGLGYLLHLPVAALATDDPAAQSRALHEFAAVDVLQCIGVSMLLLEGLRFGVARSGARLAVCVSFALVCLALAPLAAELEAEGAARPLLAYVTPRGGSLFPLTPWAAHVAVGFACGAIVRADLRWSLPRRLAAVTAVASLAYSAVAALDAPRAVGDHVSRLAWVCGAAWALSAIGERLPRTPEPIGALAQNTLLLYVFHVLLVYGHGLGLEAWIGPNLGPAGVTAATIGVIGSSAAVALGYDRLARARRTG